MLFGLTMGDTCGIGPEVLLKAWSEGNIRHQVVVYGDLDILEYYNDLLKFGVPLRRIARIAEQSQGTLNVLDAGIMRRQKLTIGQVNAESGRAAREYAVAATRAALAGEIAAMVTLPMNKEATQLSDPHFVGHTELIGDLCRAKDVTIMLVSDQLIVTHVSSSAQE